MAQPKTILCPECQNLGRLHARGLCHNCYVRLARSKDPRLWAYSRRTKTPDEWISQIDMSDPDGCWLWPGSIGLDGYGQVGGMSAQRYMWQRFVGPIASGYEPDHLCHTNDPTCPGGLPCPHRRCVNYVRHLEIVTSAENIRRKWSRRTHCKRGHPRKAGENCRTCHNEMQQARRDRQFPDRRPPPGERTHCPQGHLYDEANTYRNPSSGERACRTCKRESERRSDDRRARTRATGG